MNPQWIVSPLVGCVIGYITNWLAIKMLFRPFQAKYIGRWHIPFTPGLIPKEKGRLAQSVGDVISKSLLDANTLQGALLSNDMMDKLSHGLDALIENHKDDERTLRELISSMTGEQAFEGGFSAVRDGVVSTLSGKLIEANLGDLAAQAISEHVKKKAPAPLTSLVGGLLDDRLKLGITRQLADGVNRYIEENAHQLLGGAMDSESEKLLNMQLSALIAQYRDNQPSLKQKLLDGYRGFIKLSTERVLQTIDLSAIVRSRIAALNDRELEQLLLSVISRELNAIVWLGAGLGFIMGFTNLLFQ